MRKIGLVVGWVLLVAPFVMAAEDAGRDLDLRRAVSTDAYLVVHGRHNQERDYQKEYFKNICETVRETRIVERVVELISAQIPAADLDRAKSVLDELRQAVAPIDIHAIVDCEEAIYAQSMTQVPFSQHLFLLRTTPEDAASIQQGIKNLFGLVEKYSEGNVPIETTTKNDIELITLAVPGKSPFRPTVARIGSVLLVATSQPLAEQSLSMLMGGRGESKFDDPRLKAALAQLPEPEDSLVFYDGKLQFTQLRTLGQFIRMISGGSPDADRAAGLLETVFDEISILDFEVTVEYTEGTHNCTASYGKILPGSEEKTLHKMFNHGQEFENWSAWVPANAVAYTVSTGVYLHPAYEKLLAIVRERFPESEPFLNQFEQLQEQFDLHLDKDFLQAFSGESVSVTIPVVPPMGMHTSDSVIALRCQKPDRIRELLHRLIDVVKKNPYLAAQQIQLTDSEIVDGCEELSATMLMAFGVRPTIGFRDGWMFIGTTPTAIKKVLDTKAGEGDTVIGADSFKQFGMTIDGSVQSVSYTNIAENLRNVAAMLNQVGFFIPTIVAMSGQSADSPEMKNVQEIFGFLPSIAKIVSAFDFYEAKLSVTQRGKEPNSYTRRSVTLIRPPKSAESK